MLTNFAFNNPFKISETFRFSMTGEDKLYRRVWKAYLCSPFAILWSKKVVCKSFLRIIVNLFPLEPSHGGFSSVSLSIFASLFLFMHFKSVFSFPFFFIPFSVSAPGFTGNRFTSILLLLNVMWTGYYLNLKWPLKNNKSVCLKWA